MAEPKKHSGEHQPHGRRDRDSADDRPNKPHNRSDYTAGADGDQDIDASEAERKDSFTPDKDGTGW